MKIVPAAVVSVLIAFGAGFFDAHAISSPSNGTPKPVSIPPTTAGAVTLTPLQLRNAIRLAAKFNGGLPALTTVTRTGPTTTTTPPPPCTAGCECNGTCFTHSVTYLPETTTTKQTPITHTQTTPTQTTPTQTHTQTTPTQTQTNRQVTKTITVHHF